jgi:8-oxo-dGTP diphosphatase
MLDREGSPDDRLAASDLGALMSHPPVDWSTWTPAIRATLLFVWKDDAMLMIRKKRGLGAGKINGPGGKLDPGETPRQAAVREVMEEVGVEPIDPVARGRLRFQFVDGLRLEVHVFTAPDCVGTLRETDEAVPMWMPIDAIPYDEMWADDRIWLPRVLAGEWVELRAVFDGDAMLEHHLETRPLAG